MKDDKKNFGQFSPLDIVELLSGEGGELSSARIADAIKQLQTAQAAAERREEAERLRRERAEREERERQERELREKLEREAQESHVRDVTSMDLPLDWENAFSQDVRAQGVHIDSIPDALVMSLTTLGRVDIEYISSITGADYKSVILALRGAIYQNPETWEECFYKGWETSEEYLSGNLMRKRRAAEAANETYNGYFKDNLAAIDRVLPETVAAKDIYITLGSPWVPTDVIDDFVTYIMNMRGEKYEGTLHDEFTGTWELPNKSRYWNYVRSVNTYGTNRMPALSLLEKTLNMKTVCVTDEVGSAVNSSGKKRIVNKTETVAALEKQQQLIKEFQSWVWRDEKRKERLENIFEDKFSCVRRRIFDGSFLSFPTMSPQVCLYPYQKDAVARIIFTPNTLLAHDVGAGKTYVMAAAGMELIRMGLSKKNMYVVPNNLVGQWRSIFNTMYPDAKILCVTPNNFIPQKRDRLLERMRDEEFDGIVIAYSCFEQIPLSKEYYRRQFREQRDLIENLINQKNKATSRLEKKQEEVKKALADLSVTVADLYHSVYFDELGVTRLFVDEAHNFKNVPVETKATNVLGLGGGGSKKCRDMLDKVRLIQRQNGGGGVVFATGTPITNSITDAYIMQQYLQSGELSMLDLQSFDSWIGMFAERVTEFEVDVDTSSYRLATRFAKFHNLPELTALLSSIADFHQAGVSAGIPETDGYDDAVLGRTAEFADYLKIISRRADHVRHGLVDRRDDNMLKITTDGRKAALDFRLVEPTSAFTYQSKVARCVENVADIYYRTLLGKSAQLIFCDISTPKAGFNLYDELKHRLISQGISPDEIAYAHDATSETARERLFSRVRDGEVRVLIGSTFKLGLGVNIQDKLIALHHLDVPWRPADMTQREGRILRQGNLNKKVRIFRYITEGSFDAYSWQLLETKARFIGDLLSGSLSERSGSDIDDTVLDYAEVKALAVGNPLVKERVETANELARYVALQRKTVETRLRLERELSELPAKMQEQALLVARGEADLFSYNEWQAENPPSEDLLARQEELEGRRRLRSELRAAIAENILETTERVLCEYRGFEIVLPANMTPDRPYVFLRREGKYYVELGGTEFGNLVRIDNFLDTFADHLSRLKTSLITLGRRDTEIRSELLRGENYAERIEECKKKLDDLDKQLGAKQ